MMLSANDLKDTAFAASICVIGDVLVNAGLISEADLQTRVEEKHKQLNSDIEKEVADRLAGKLLEGFGSPANGDKEH